jgi:hypothetical protein
MDFSLFSIFYFQPTACGKTLLFRRRVLQFTLSFAKGPPHKRFVTNRALAPEESFSIFFRNLFSLSSVCTHRAGLVQPSFPFSNYLGAVRFPACDFSLSVPVIPARVAGFFSHAGHGAEGPGNTLTSWTLHYFPFSIFRLSRRILPLLRFIQSVRTNL